MFVVTTLRRTMGRKYWHIFSAASAEKSELSSSLYTDTRYIVYIHPVYTAKEFLIHGTMPLTVRSNWLCGRLQSTFVCFPMILDYWLRTVQGVCDNYYHLTTVVRNTTVLLFSDNSRLWVAGRSRSFVSSMEFTEW